MNKKSIYTPKEDTELLIEYIELQDLENKKILDMGTGSGIITKKSLHKNPKYVLAVDINPDSIKRSQKRFSTQKNVEVKKSDLFSEIKQKNFDYISFNPPYLPEIKNDSGKKETTWDGGKKGIETINRFLESAHKYLSDDGKIILIISSKTDLKEFNHKSNSQSYKKELLKKKKLFFEELYLYELTKQP